MRIFVPGEDATTDSRVPVVPATVAKLVKLGASVSVERSLGAPLLLTDEDYQKAGAEVVGRADGFAAADMVLRLRKPAGDEIAALRKGAIHVSYLDPFNEPALVRALAAAGVSAVSMEMIPRSTIAQKMDALSSQANLAGYDAVILAAAATRQDSADDDDARRHDPAGARVRHRRRRRGLAGHRHGETAGRARWRRSTRARWSRSR